MQTLSPYEPPSGEERFAALTSKPRSRKHWTTIGFLIFSLIPIFYGLARLHHESVYYASLPPGTAACGMGSLGALVIIIFGVPVFGLIGGTIGWVANRIRY
jgi:hypothetical protein